MSLDADPRWLRLNGHGTPCACCGRSFQGVFDIGFDHPECWQHGNLSESGEDELIVGQDRLGTDLCIWGPHRFIRCVLPLPIQGSDVTFSFGIWGSASEDSFRTYVRAASEDGTDFAGCFSWLSNSVPGFETEDSVACDLKPGAVGERPSLHPHDGVLAEAQAKGISFDLLLDIYAASGTDIRPHLMDA